MPENSPEPEKTAIEAKTAPQGGMPRRFGIGVNVLVQVFLTLLIFVGINRLNYRYYTRFDLSPTQSFTLSDSTKNILSTLSRDVTIYMVFARDSKIFGEVSSLLEEYRLHGRQRIKLRTIDPVRDIERAENLKAETGLSLAQNGILLISGSNKRFIIEDELVVREAGIGTEKKITEFRGEDAVTSALANVLEGKMRRFYYITSKGSRSDAAVTESLEAIVEIGRQQNFEVLAISLSDVASLTAHADGIIMIGAKYDLTERELRMLDDYWNSNRTGILMLLDPNRITKNLDLWLAANGVKPRRDRVLMARSTSAGAKKEFSVQALFSREVSFTQHLANNITNIAGQSESLELSSGESNPTLKEKNIVVNPVLRADDFYWGETNYYDELPVADESEDTLPPVYVGASVERGAAADASKRVESSRMVVVGNPTLLDKSSMLAVNRDFVAASLNWIINRENLIGITSKPKRSYRIQLTPKQHDVIFWITSLAMPGVILALGMAIWAGRRAA